MSTRYIPQIRQAVIPEDGGWAELSNGAVLILSIPEWTESNQALTREMQSVWLYDRANDAYLYCFKLADGQEYAIAFAKEHAGVLLADERTKEPFAMLITAQPLAAEEYSPYLLISDVVLKKHPKAGW
ncbi:MULTISPECIES: hypothetical protein [Laceyella]|jgi:hypothetical protein|uniref:Uncharacterized protein n=1 Tax=Laceyella sacchari TaxID=37482 RepID=A0ABY5U0Q4_LACSH|nr:MULTISPECIES: hypothetical protein [Laceyella]KPC72533.1 hypothetical protein ADL26_14395 [Thermoactinomyces vulgaris]TCW38903.1 hypothetical protein EDC32_102142 [Laceyella sacchari]UWE03238.1 hypothetical protein NYR52_14135 [Laceyella sacchari]